MSNQKLLLIDGNSILNRAYFALPPLNDKDGCNVNAVYGFVNILLKCLDNYKPDKLVVAFDKRGHNFRKDLYPDYKANRKGMPDDLAQQMPVLHELLNCLSITVVEKEGVEADDIIGTVSKSFDGESFIVSGDRDMWQLVSDKVTVLYTKRGVTEVEVITPETLMSNYNLCPSQVIEYKALRGDSSDNIPGVKGVGEKTAMLLLSKYGDIEFLYQNIHKEKGALREKLEQNKELAFISRVLATIVTDADVEFDLTATSTLSYSNEAKELLEKLQFRTVLEKFAVDSGGMFENNIEVSSEDIISAERFGEVLSQMEKSPFFAFHFSEGCVMLSSDAKKQYKVLWSNNFLDELNEQTVVDSLRPFLKCQTPKAVYDVKALRHLLNAYGLAIENVRYDICLMQYLVEYRAYKDLSGLCKAYGYDDLGAGIFAVAEKLQSLLTEHGVERLYYDVELPLADLLYRMEMEGVKVDTELLETMSRELSDKLASLKSEIWELAGEKFNVNSPMQLSYVLFDKLNLPHGKKTHREYYTTNNEVLEKLVDLHPIAGKILEHRKYAKLLNTYVDGLRPMVKNGLVHTMFNQSLTSTGRLSSSDPNLQNIPIRNELGKEIRKLFCSKYGVFVGADYSQIELRLLAAFSADDNMLDSFKREEDIHARVAGELMGVPPQMVNADMRRMAKAVNFGIIYGISDYGLSQSTKLSVKKARDYIQLYFERFPKIKAYLDGCVESVKNTGYAVTITGRRRQIPEIKSSNYNLRSFGERAAMNMPLQGSAADIMKIAMLKVDNAIKQAGLKSKIVMQIHDELIVDCYIDEAQTVKEILKREMERAVELACPLTVETEEGATLYEA